MTDHDLDTRFAGIGAIEPSDALVRDTLRAIAQERARSRWGRVAVFAGGGMALAAALLLTVTVPNVHERAPMQTRGIGSVLPTVEVKSLVRQGEQVSRLRTDTRYSAGDTVLFRVFVSEEMDVTLSRNGKTLWNGHVPAGESDLPVGYQLEAGEDAATFTVEGGGVAQAVHVGAVVR
jgi:hypothetical protein